MRELLSKKSHRQLELLELLFKNKRWFHISELAELLNCTERSVKDDLSHVKSSFPQLIFHSSTNGIRIINTDDSDIEMVYHHFFKHSTHFSILELVSILLGLLEMRLISVIFLHNIFRKNIIFLNGPLQIFQ